MSMLFVLHCQVVSPHHLSFMRKVVAVLGEENVRYVYTRPMGDERKALGWSNAGDKWICFADGGAAITELLLNSKVLVSSVRDVTLFEKRVENGRLTLYMSERWFKPFCFCRILFPGTIRLLNWSFLKMTIRMVRLIKSNAPFYYLPMSVWAARDMAFLCGYHGRIAFELKAGGLVWAGKRIVDKFRIWAYFVERSRSGTTRSGTANNPIRHVLWVGRLVLVKRVGDIVKAVRQATSQGARIELDIYGHGDDEVRVKKLANDLENVHFHDPVPIEQVRNLMQSHDVYVLSSNAMEGWGAVVNEAVEEGMRVIGTYEAGGSSTLLPDECLYHAGDVNALCRMLCGDIPKVDISNWSCDKAAEFILNLFNENNSCI